MPRSVVLVVLLLSCASPAPNSVADPSSARTLALGPVVGSAGLHGGHVWRGLPYAAPPVGELRWRAPRPPEPWTAPRESLAFGPRCLQLGSPLEGSGDGEVIGDEDCLRLNVYAPRFSPDAVPTGDARRPVMLWVHGGGNTIGAGSFYDGSALAERQGVVVVTINYRLGPLGWFRHASLRGPGTTPADHSGNFGTLDIVRALEWVKEHIAAFGGDPGNVTVFGESAGGRNVFTMLLSPLAEGLFHRAIVQSGGTGHIPAAVAENLREADPAGHPHSSGEVLLRVLRDKELASDRASAIHAAETLAGEQTATLLREIPGPELFRFYGADESEPGLSLVSLPRVFGDGHVLPEDDRAAFAAGRYHRVPVMLGSNRDEQKLFLMDDPDFTWKLFGFAPRIRDEARYERASRYKSRAWKAGAVDEIAAMLVRHQPDVYAYRFDWDELPTVLGSDLSQILGAAHALEIPFVFGHFDLGPRSSILYDAANAPGRDALAGDMMAYWAEFAASGNPGRGGNESRLPWAAWNPAEGASKYLVLDTPNDGGLRMRGETESLAGLSEELGADSSLDETERCALGADLVDWWTTFEAPTRC